MAITAAELNVKFGSSGVDGVKADMDGLSNRLEGLGSKLTAVGQKWSMFVTAPILAGFGASYMQAAGLEQALGKVDAVYGDLSAGIIKWSEDSAEAYGISQRGALDMVGTYGQIMQAQGMAQDQSAEYSKTLLGLAADMSAFSDRDISESSNAIRAALTGEYEALKSFGIVLKAADVEQEALNLAIAQGRNEVTEADRVQARYNLILKQTTKMQGQFGRESKGASGQLAIFKANLQDLAANLGAVLLPIGTKVTQFLNNMMQAFMKLPKSVTTVIVVIAALAAAIGPLLIALGAMATGLAALPAVIAGVGAAFGLLFSPAVLAIVAAIGAAIVAYKTNFLGFADMVDGAIGKLKDFYTIMQIAFGGEPAVKQATLDIDTAADTTYDDWQVMPDGTVKNADLNISATGSGPAFITKIENPDSADGWDYTLNVDVTGDGVQDATKIIDSVDQGGGNYVMTVELNDQQYQVWYNEATGQAIYIPVEMDTREATGKMAELQRTAEGIKTWFQDLRNFFSGDWSEVDWDHLLGWSRFKTKMSSDIDQIKGWFTGAADFISGIDWGGVWDTVFSGFMAAIDAAVEAWNTFQSLITGGASRAADDPNYEKSQADHNEALNPTQPAANGTTRTPYSRYQDSQGNAINPATGMALSNFERFAGMFNVGAQAANEFRDALSGLNQPAQQVSTDLNLMASSAQYTDVAVFGAGQSIQATGAGIGATFGQIASDVASRSAEAATSAISQFGSMSTTTAGHFLGMQTAAALQMALMATTATTQGSATTSNLVGALAGGTARVAVIMAIMTATVTNSLSSAAASATTYGVNIAAGLAEGIWAGIPAVAAAAAAMVAAAQAAIHIKGMFGSPSRLTRKYGLWWGEGMEDGIRNTIPDVARASAALVGAGAPTAAFSATGLMANSRNQQSDRPSVSVTFSGNFYGSNRAELDEWAETSLMPAFVSVLNDERRGQLR